MRVNDERQNVRPWMSSCPASAKSVGGSQREERLDILEERMQEQKLDLNAYWWYRDLRASAPSLTPVSAWAWNAPSVPDRMANIRDVIAFPRTPRRADF